MKEEMLEFLEKAQLPIYFEERELIREFIETFFSRKHQPERSKREDCCPKCANALIADQGSFWCQKCNWRGWISNTADAVL